MSETKDNFYAVFGAILCGRCVCGERLCFSEGQVYKSLPDCALDTLIDKTNSWLVENKAKINEAFDKYHKLRENDDYQRVDMWVFVNEWDPSDQIRVENIGNLIEEFRVRVPILVKVQDSYETCHLICMLDHLRVTD